MLARFAKEFSQATVSKDTGDYIIWKHLDLPRWTFKQQPPKKKVICNYPKVVEKNVITFYLFSDDSQPWRSFLLWQMWIRVHRPHRFDRPLATKILHTENREKLDCEKKSKKINLSTVYFKNKDAHNFERYNLKQIIWAHLDVL